MDLREVLSSVTSNFLTSKTSSFIYFSVPGKLMNTIQGAAFDDFHIIDLKEDTNPVKPFYSIMKLSNPSEESIEKYAYSLHKDALLSFFKTGICCDRLDVLQFAEIFYEKQKFSQFTVNILKEHFTDNFIVLNSQLLPLESITFIKKYLEGQFFKGKIIFCFNNDEILNFSTEMENFYHGLETCQEFYDITDVEDFDFTAKNTVKDTKPIEETIPTFTDLYASIKNCRTFLALDQALKTTKWLIDNISRFNFSVEQIRKLYFEMALCNFYNNQLDDALYILNQLIAYRIEDDIELSAYLLTSRIYFAKNMNSETLRTAVIIKERMKFRKLEPFYALACMLEYSASQKKDFSTSLEKFYATLELLLANGLVNNYLLTGLNIPWAVMNDDKLRVTMISQIDNIIDLAIKIDNKYALSTAYNWKGIILLHNGQREEAHEWYSKCNEIRTEIGDLSAIVKIRNGLSYEYLISTQYKKAYDLLNDFSNRLTDVKENTEIIITLNNIANTLFYSCHFAESYEIYQKIQQLLILFHYENDNAASFLPEFNDILIHKTYLDLYGNNLNRAKINFYNILHNHREFTKINEPLKYLFEAIIKLQEGNIDSAYALFAEAENSFKNFSSAQAFRHVFIIYEFSSFLQKEKICDKIPEFMNKALEISKKYKLNYFLHDENTPISIEEYQTKPEKFEPLKLNFQKLDDMLNKERIIIQMHKHLRDAQFLNKLVVLQNGTYEDSDFMKTAIHILMEYYPSDGIFIGVKEDTRWICHGQNVRRGNIKVTSKDWERLFKKFDTITPNCSFVKDEVTGWYYAKSSEYHIPGAMIVVPSKTMLLTQESINIMNIAITNIKSQYVIFRQNQRLSFISSTDQLSMLNNRRALQEKLNIESEMIARYQSKREKYFQVSIAFIDLDNFKFINDTFGHETGDLIISKFADLLRQIYRRVDFISRFGGDEFVILLPNTDCIEAQRAAERLKEALLKADHFIPDMEHHLGKKLNISEKNKLNFSMGICSNFDIDDPTDMNTTMTNADRSLYYSKEHGKGCVTIWSKIKDEYKAEN